MEEETERAGIPKRNNEIDPIAVMTRTAKRGTLYHFTRASNLQAIAFGDELLASVSLQPQPQTNGERRTSPVRLMHGGHSATLNAHLRIPESVMDDSITQEQFRLFLDSHVFFWPTLRDALVMLDTYRRREPDEAFALLAFDAAPLLTAHAEKVKLCKYDSGSAPRYPKACSYKKSLAIFLPLNQFGKVKESIVPTRTSEIKEVLIERRVSDLTRYLQVVYADTADNVPTRWLSYLQPLSALRPS
ncbi:DUF7002 family protein [Paenibacillus sp. NPDC058071]|uniref:DUF7002 family protein n=1 Tax=Paenibacillus sp. NPDC058071 TaxID=3346326 RepID=UPI0036DF1CB0